MAVPVAVDDDGDGRVLAHAPDELVSTAWDQAVDELGELHELDGGLVGGVLDEDDAVLG